MTLKNADKSDQDPKSFTFDAAYDETCTQEGFYGVGEDPQQQEWCMRSPIIDLYWL